MRTLLLNPPSFEQFDGGAGARYPATREISAFWYPTWLAYPAGLIPRSRLLDAPAHSLSPEETILISSEYDFVVLFTSTAGFRSDVRLAEKLKEARPGTKVAFVGPHVTVLPEQTLNASRAIDLVVRKEFDYAVAEFAEGRSPEKIAGISFRSNGRILHNPDRPPLEDLDQLPFAVEIFKRDLDFRKYSIPFLLYPYVSFYTSRGCPSRCTFCLWPQTISGHRWRTRGLANVMEEFRRARELFPAAKEIFFDDDTFTCNKARVLELCRELKRERMTWSCNSRVTVDYETLREMKDSGCRLLVVGFESGDPGILNNIRKGTTPEQALAFMKNCRKLGLEVHGDFQVGLPGETPASIERTVRFAMQLDPDTIQVSISHPYPGTLFYEYLRENGYSLSGDMADERGHQLAIVEYPGLSRADIMQAVSDFYNRYYFRPGIVFRILRKAVFAAEERKRLYREAREFFRFQKRTRDLIRSSRGRATGP